MLIEKNKRSKTTHLFHVVLRKPFKIYKTPHNTNSLTTGGINREKSLRITGDNLIGNFLVGVLIFVGCPDPEDRAALGALFRYRGVVDRPLAQRNVVVLVQYLDVHLRNKAALCRVHSGGTALIWRGDYGAPDIIQEINLLCRRRVYKKISEK